MKSSSSFISWLVRFYGLLTHIYIILFCEDLLRKGGGGRAYFTVSSKNYPLEHLIFKTKQPKNTPITTTTTTCLWNLSHLLDRRGGKFHISRNRHFCLTLKVTPQIICHWKALSFLSKNL